MNCYTEGTVDPCIPAKYVSDEDMKTLTERDWDSDDPQTDISCEYDKDRKNYYFYITSDNTFEEEQGPPAFQRILRKMPQTVPVIVVELAHYANRHRMGEFGGSACVISRDKIEWEGTGIIIIEKTKAAKQCLKKLNNAADINWDEVCQS